MEMYLIEEMPIEMIANTTDMNNLGEQELTLQTIGVKIVLWKKCKKEVIARVGEMMIYPNPASTEATISYSLEKESASMSIKVIDAQGKEMLVDQITNPTMSGTYNINLNNYSAGIYFVKVQAGNFIETKKLIVDRR